MLKNIMLLITIIGTSACTPTVVEKRVPVAVELSRPARPSFTKIMNDDVGCLSVDTQKQFISRDMQMKLYMQELEEIIDATHSSGSGKGL